MCNSVFSFSLVRGQLSAGAVCVAVREIFFFVEWGCCWKLRDLDGGHLLGVSGCPQQRGKGRKSVVVFSQLLDIILRTSAG